MRGLGTVLLIILFSVGFAMYLGTDGKYGSGYLELAHRLDSMTINDIANLIANVFSDWGFIATVGVVSLATAAVSRSVFTVAMTFLLTALADILFVPFTFVNEIPFSNEPLMYFIRGLFHLLLLIAILTFVTGNEF